MSVLKIILFSPFQQSWEKIWVHNFSRIKIHHDYIIAIIIISQRELRTLKSFRMIFFSLPNGGSEKLWRVGGEKKMRSSFSTMAKRKTQKIILAYVHMLHVARYSVCARETRSDQMRNAESIRWWWIFCLNENFALTWWIWRVKLLFHLLLRWFV